MAGNAANVERISRCAFCFLMLGRSLPMALKHDSLFFGLLLVGKYRKRREGRQEMAGKIPYLPLSATVKREAQRQREREGIWSEDCRTNTDKLFILSSVISSIAIEREIWFLMN